MPNYDKDYVTATPSTQAEKFIYHGSDFSTE